MKTLSQILLSQRVIAFNPVLALIAGDVKAGLMLSQCCYWSERTSDPAGWFWKTQDEWFEETCMSRREIESARKKLVSIGVLNHQIRGVPARSFYQVDWHVLEMLITHKNSNENASLAESAILEPVDKKPNENASLAESAKQEWRKAPNKNGGKRQTRMAESAKQEWRKAPNPLTESTQESTQKNTADKRSGFSDDLEAQSKSEVMTKGEAKNAYNDVMRRLLKETKGMH